MARWPRDGILYLTSNCECGEDTWASVTTRPFVLLGSELLVSLDVEKDGGVEVSLLLSNQDAISGGDELRTGKRITSSGSDVRVLWGGGQRLTPLIGRTLMIRFRMRKAKLFAFQIQRVP